MTEPTPITYSRWFVAGEPMMKCDTCGALTTDQDTHSGWHEDLDDYNKTHTEAIRAIHKAMGYR